MKRSPRFVVAVRTLLIACSVVAIMGVGSCSGSKPEILYSEAELFVVDDRTTGERYESIRLYVAVNDGDGADDIGVVYVDHADEQLYWEFDESTWVRTEFAGDNWIGMPDIRMADGSPLPRGRYRVIVEDRALQRVQGQFSITADPIDPAALEFPRLVTSPNLVVVADNPVVLRVYSRSGQMPVNGQIPPGAVPADLLQQLPNESGLTAYLTMRGDDGVRLISGPYAIPR